MVSTVGSQREGPGLRARCPPLCGACMFPPGSCEFSPGAPLFPATEKQTGLMTVAVPTQDSPGKEILSPEFVFMVK